MSKSQTHKEYSAKADESLELTDHLNIELPSTESAKQEHYIRSWQYLDDLGAEYHEFVKQGYGTSIENRNTRQLEIANIIAKRTTPYVYTIAHEMTKGAGVKIQPQGKIRILKINGCTTPIEDLVQEGIVGVIEGLHRYDPSRGSMSNYILYAALQKIQRAACKDLGILILPDYLVHSLLPVRDLGPKKAMEKIREQVSIWGENPDAEMAAAIYHGLRKEYINIHDRVGGGSVNTPSIDTFEGRYLPDESEDADVQKVTMKRHLHDELEHILSKLHPREREVVQKRFGFWNGDGVEYSLENIAKELGVTPQRIQQIEARALQQLRRSSIARRLLKEWVMQK